ncbi:MAG: sulfite exporter TauE/SafE family protein [Pseudomonadota bacterium]|nr:MAG: sulfite exporter TauE/SafE family protein [Pseudomonadota bacterium]
MDIVMLVVMGGLAGVMAGLLGIGGGALIVPVLAIVFEAQGVERGVIMQSALGTSLATIAFTAISATLAHHRRGAVEWRIVALIAPGIVLGAWLGAYVAAISTMRVLQIMFVIFLFALAAHMARGRIASRPHGKLPGPVGMGAVGIVIGVASALFGIGGGALSVPFMTWCSIPVKRAIATSSGIGLVIALGGSIGFIVAGWEASGRPPWSIGYVVLPAMAGIVVASMAAAPFGARLAHRLSDVTLRRIFAVFVFILGVHMLWGLLK